MEVSQELFANGTVIYGGDTEQQRSGISIKPWKAVAGYEIDQS